MTCSWGYNQESRKHRIENRLLVPSLSSLELIISFIITFYKNFIIFILFSVYLYLLYYDFWYLDNRPEQESQAKILKLTI